MSASSMVELEMEFIGEFSSDGPHPGSLMLPKPLRLESGETKDALIHIAVAQVLPDESGLHSGHGEEQAGLEKLQRWASAAAERGPTLLCSPSTFSVGLRMSSGGG